MGLKYGFNITASDMRKLLAENDRQQSGVRTWRQLFGNAALGYNAQSGMLQNDYASAMNEAYRANFAQRDAIFGAGYNVGATKEMLGANRNDLLNAYNTYIRNFSNDANTIAENYSKEVSVINTALTQRAENFAKLYNSAYDYLSNELYGSSFVRDGETVDVLTDQGLDWLYLKDEQGNLTDEIMSWEQLSRELFNEDGSLTEKGIAFYDQMFNMQQQGWTRSDAKGEEIQTRGFDKWLSDTNTELRDWWAGQDEFNYTFAGTNRGTAFTQMGLESTDQSYSRTDYRKLKGDINLAGFDTIDEYNSATKEYDRVKKEYDEKINAAIEYARTHDRDASAAAKVSELRNEQQAALTEVWTKYYNALEFSYYDLLDEVKDKLGQAGYKELSTQYADIMGQLEKLIKQKPADVSELADVYNKFLRGIYTYQNTKRKKSSGF